MIKRLFNVAIAVHDIDDATRRYQRLFGFRLGDVAESANLGIRTAMLVMENTTIELVQPLVLADSPVARFLARRGEGLYMVFLEVDDLEEHERSLDAAGVRYVRRRGRYAPNRGEEHEFMEVFVHPKDAGGVAVGLVQFLDKRS